MSGGYAYGDEPETIYCPYCRTICKADFVDIGVGMQQCGPYHCNNCRASEVGPYDDTDKRPLTQEEYILGWYAPRTPPGSSANVVHGRPVTHRQMLRTYREAFTDNILWNDKAYVADWWQAIRAPNEPGTP